MTEADCRCSICDCCKHDHNGWNHEWTAKTPPEPECDHLLTYVTPMSGLDGLYWRCRDCSAYWRMDPHRDFASVPQRYVLGADQVSVEDWNAQALRDMELIIESGENLGDEPDEWGYDSNGNVVDLR